LKETNVYPISTNYAPETIVETRIRPEGSEYKADLGELPQYGQPTPESVRPEIKEATNLQRSEEDIPRTQHVGITE
jgi:hypothetical protein